MSTVWPRSSVTLRSAPRWHSTTPTSALQRHAAGWWGGVGWGGVGWGWVGGGGWVGVVGGWVGGGGGPSSLNRAPQRDWRSCVHARAYVRACVRGCVGARQAAHRRLPSPPPQPPCLPSFPAPASSAATHRRVTPMSSCAGERGYDRGGGGVRAPGEQAEPEGTAHVAPPAGGAAPDQRGQGAGARPQPGWSYQAVPPGGAQRPPGGSCCRGGGTGVGEGRMQQRKAHRCRALETPPEGPAPRRPAAGAPPPPASHLRVRIGSGRHVHEGSQHVWGGAPDPKADLLSTS